MQSESFNPITAGSRQGDRLASAENGVALNDMSTAKGPKLSLDEAITRVVFLVKRFLGGYLYYEVLWIFLRPIVFISTAANSNSESILKYLAIAIAGLAVLYSFPFIVVKSEMASYLVKIHYPFLMSSQAGDRTIRTVMLTILQDLQEEIVILTVLLGSVTELLLIGGNFVLAIGEILNSSSPSWTLVGIAFANLASALYTFYHYCVHCMKIMCYRAHQKDCYKGCCCCCFMCLSDDIKNNVADLVGTAKFDFGDTKQYARKELPNEDFQSQLFIKKFTTTKSDGTVILNLDEIGKEDPKCSMTDRYGLLSIGGGAKLLIMKKRDADQKASEDSESQGFLCSIISQIFSTLVSIFTSMCSKLIELLNAIQYCITIVSMYYIALGYAWCDGVCIALEWYVFGLNFERHFQKACDTVVGSLQGLTNEEINSMKGDYDLIKKLQSIPVKDSHGITVSEIIVLQPVKRQMPYGMAWLGPVVKTCSCLYYAMIGCCYPLYCISQFCNPKLKYKVTAANILSPHLLANILLRSDAVIPHSLFQKFPLNTWPFDGSYDRTLVLLGEALNVLCDLYEMHRLRQLKLISEDESILNFKTPSNEVIEAIINIRSGDVVVAANDNLHIPSGKKMER